MRGNSSVGLWALLVWALLILFVAIPWVMRHPPPHDEQLFGASVKPAHR
jgi:hypothetical protein